MNKKKGEKDKAATPSKFCDTTLSDSQIVQNIPSIPKQTLQIFLKYKYALFFTNQMFIFHTTYSEEILRSTMRF